MPQKLQFLLVAPLVALGSFLFCAIATAQITPDRTLGSESSTVRQDTIKGIKSDVIEGGATRGANLFHSFQEFNISEGRGAYFANPAAIENILTRVTGGNPSNILGTLGVLGNANLFLINPNGIIFGANARLDVRGAFVASTADSILFNHGFEFSASNPQAPPLLTVNIPIGLRFREKAGDINNAGNLSVPKDLTLKAENLDLSGSLLAGGNLTLEARDTVKVRDSVTKPFIAAAGENLLLQGDRAVDIFALNHPNSGLFSGGDLVLRSANQVSGDAHFWSGGNFRIEKLDGSLGDLVSLNDPIIRALGDVSFDYYEGVSLHIIAGGAVNAGTVIITGTEADTEGIDFNKETVQLSDGTEVAINGSIQPTLDIRAGVSADKIGVPNLTGFDFFSDFIFPIPNLNLPATSANITIGDVWIQQSNGLVLLTNQYHPNSLLSGGDIQINPALGAFNYGIDVGNVYSGFVGNSGSVIIDSRNNVVLNNSVIDTTSTRVGNAGDILIKANGEVSLVRSLLRSNIGAASGSGAVGNVGTIKLEGKSVSLSNETQIQAGFFSGGQGNGGLISIQGTDSVSLNNAALFANNESGSVGNSSNIQISGQSISLTNALLNTNNAGQGNAGNILLDSRGKITLTSSHINASSVFGNGGDITLLANDDITLTPGSLMRSDGLLGGNITLKSDAVISVADSLIFSRSFTQVSNTTGRDISVTARSFSLTDGALVSAETFGQGTAGNVTITAQDLVFLDGLGKTTGVLSSVGEKAKGSGGNVNITTGSLFVENGGLISASTLGEGNAGNVTIAARNSVSFDGVTNDELRFPSGAASLVGTSAKGKGGNINITTSSLSLTNGAQLSSASLGEGDAGNITITAEDSVVAIDAGLGARTLGKGDAGNVTITAGNSVSFDGVGRNGRASGADSLVAEGAEGKGGNVNITTGSLSVTGGAQLSARTLGKGDAGNVNITTGFLSVTGGALLDATTFGKGDAGNVTITASDSVSLDGVGSDGQSSKIASAVGPEAKGNGGWIDITTRSLSVTDGALITASTFEQGNAGNVTITASDSVSIDGVGSNGQRSGVGSSVQDGAKGNGGNVTITTRSLSVTDGAGLSATTLGEGNAGNLTISANDSVLFDGNSIVSSQVLRGASGRGGNLNITTGSLSVTGGAQLSATTFGKGNAGSVTITARDSVAFDGVGNNRTFSGVFSAVNSGAVGSGGNIVIETDLLFLNRAFIAADTLGQGNAGNISIQATEAVSLANSSSIGTGVLGGVGKGGDIQLKTGSLSLTDMSLITAATEGQGDAGNISIQATEAVSLKFSAITTDVLSLESSAGVRQGGDIALKAGSLSLTDVSSIAAATSGRGDAGNITVQVDDSISIANSSISNSVEPGGVGNGGEMDIQARSLTLTNGGQIESRVFGEFYSPVLNRNLPGGQGKGGNIRIDAADFVSISGVRLSDVIVNGINLGGKGESSGLFASTERGASGSAGSIAVTTPDFRLSEGAVVNTLTANDGNAGNITINANTFEATGGGQVITTTRNRGRAGNITLNITDSINLSGSDPTFANRLAKFGEDIVNNQGAESGLFANTATGSTGDGGSIFIDPNQVNLSDGAKISVNSQGQGDGGSIFLTADNLSLNNASEISAATASGEGGNITLNVADLLRQRNNSPISATAGGTGNGGNITIDTDFLVSSENSDITANAFEGRGGNIRITATGIFLAPGSEITASSELGVDGVVEINTPETEPSRGLVDLPENVVDPNKLIAQNACRQGGRSEFTITGRGGLPSTPEQIQNSDEVEVNLVEPAEESAATVTSPSISTAAKEIVPAQGWVRNEKGEVVLVGYNPANTGIQRQGRNTSSCQPR
jgi:filamentous hemagglutinin family protein